uniref:Rubisco LSMT substrate-binding domain-containing protein n=1 Tax=Auxenochlorella protothecoides TaxID=3075 RepID=A0A1D2A541_AUXPR
MPAPSTSPGALLSSWVVLRGGSVHSALHVRTSPTAGLGLGVSSAVSPGTILVRLPLAAQLGAGGAADSDLQTLLDRVPAELWGARLGLHALRERAVGEGAGAFWPYIAALPSAFPGVPLFFPGEAVEALQYPPILQQINKRSRWLVSFAREHLAAPRPAFAHASIDMGGLAWAWAAASSRAFRAQRGAAPVLLPLIDLANHTFDGPTAKVEGSADATCLVAARQLRAGEEVSLNYGPLSNDDLFLDYGFIVPGNPHDDVQLQFDLSLIEAARALVGLAALEGLAPAARAALEALGLAGAPGLSAAVAVRRARAGVQGPCDARLLAGLRAVSAQPAELEGLTLRALGDWASPLSLVSEAKALRTLTGLCAISLSHFPTTAEEDAEVLRKGGMSGPMALAVQFRLEKKRILDAGIKACAARIRELQG